MSRTLIIAEAGVNHNGNIALAKELIDVAAKAGVDYVKFQTFQADKLVKRDAKKADYQLANYNDGTDSQHDMLKKLELDANMHKELIDHCTQKGIKFLSTPFDEDSITLLQSFGVTIGKIPSGEITNLPYLRKMAKAFPEIILSTGMSTMQEVKAAIEALIAAGTKKEDITVLHCNTEYPTPMADVNLKAMMMMKNEFGIPTGYSDHTLGIEVPIAAVALGAVVIEKHFTLDKSMEGPDHKASLEPDELVAMVSAIRNVELAISGSGYKEPSQSEKKNIDVARKSLYAAIDAKVGHILSENDLVILRPGNGISPMEIDNIVGKQLTKDIKAGQQLASSDFL